MTRVIRASDLTILYSFTGSGTKEFTVGNNFDTEVFFRRELPDGTVIMRTLPATQRINFGNNGVVPLFYGAEVQLAQSADVSAIKTVIDTYLDAAISTRLPTSSYVAPDNASITDIETKVDAIPAALTIINNGVKKSSLLIPHTDNI